MFGIRAALNKGTLRSHSECEMMEVNSLRRSICDRWCGEPEALERSAAVDEALSCLSSFMSGESHSQVKNSQLYMLNREDFGDWLDVGRCLLERRKLHVVF